MHHTFHHSLAKMFMIWIWNDMDKNELKYVPYYHTIHILYVIPFIIYQSYRVLQVYRLEIRVISPVHRCFSRGILPLALPATEVTNDRPLDLLGPVATRFCFVNICSHVPVIVGVCWSHTMHLI